MNNFLNMYKMYQINESFKYGNEGNVEEIFKLGEIDIIDMKKNEIVKVHAGDIIKVVNEALL